MADNKLVKYIWK